MKSNDRYDSLFEYYADKHLKETNICWKTLKSQAFVESSMNPDAVSPVGAEGLMQFLPSTFAEWGKDNIRDPEQSIEAAAKYLRHLYNCYSEIPLTGSRLRFTFAAYNAGRGNINKMLEKARKDCGQPSSYADWKKQGSESGVWQSWNFSAKFLREITGKDNADETIHYVFKIDNLIGVEK